jgi:hypothetical protein
MLTGINVETNQMTNYPIANDQLSRHYNISHDGKFFAGDGEPASQQATIKLLIPQPDGKLLTKPLCSIAKNNFIVREPNVIISPDDKWVIFTSTQSGNRQAYAVEVADPQPAFINASAANDNRQQP